MQLTRLLGSAVVAALVTVLLLGLMQQLIDADYQLKEEVLTKIADIHMGSTDIETYIADRKPNKPNKPEEEPPELDQPQLEDIDIKASGIKVSPSLKAELSFTGPGLSASDGEYLPIVKVQPQYPRRAQSRGIEGYCIVEYTVTPLGTTIDAKAVDCSPKGMFESASVRASLKFKYKPRIENGEPIAVPGVKNKFTYRIAN